MVNFVTRLVRNHELLLLPLYPFLQKYMGGQQRNVTAVLAYTVQACHEYVPPDEVYGILKTIAHNFIADRCSEEQMAVGINAARSICHRVPSVLSVEESSASTGTTSMDIEAFTRDLAAFANHRDRSVSIVAEYEAKKAAQKRRKDEGEEIASEDDSISDWEEVMNDAKEEDEDDDEQEVDIEDEEAPTLVNLDKASEVDIEEQDGSDDEEWESDDEEGENDGEEGESDGEEASNLVNMDKASEGEDEMPLDLSKMTREEREKLKQDLSATRIFSAKDFQKMRKLVAREQRAKRDPMENARRKRAIAQGKEFEELSDDDSDSEGEEVNIAGAVNPADIMANAAKKKQNKAERIAQSIASREKFESNARAGGSTNIEKRRKKNFQMTKFSEDARSKGTQKGNLSKKRREKGVQLKHEKKKRRRKT
jgi:protein SDA1